MMTALELLEAWRKEPEGERLEFKEAKQNYHFEKLAMEAVECIIGAGRDGKTEIPAGITGAVEWKGLCPAAPRRWQRKKRAGEAALIRHCQLHKWIIRRIEKW
jgi:hypothetical protein